MSIDDNIIAEAINDITKWRTWSHTYDNACMDGERNEEKQGLEYAENILDSILREQEGSEE